MFKLVKDAMVFENIIQLSRHITKSVCRNYQVSVNPLYKAVRQDNNIKRNTRKLPRILITGELRLHSRSILIERARLIIVTFLFYLRLINRLIDVD